MKKLILIVTLITIMILGVCANNAKANIDDQRMVVISDEHLGEIVYDRETNIEYWRSTGSYNPGTLTVLLNEDGSPLIFERN